MLIRENVNPNLFCFLVHVFDEFSKEICMGIVGWSNSKQSLYFLGKWFRTIHLIDLKGICFELVGRNESKNIYDYNLLLGLLNI